MNLRRWVSDINLLIVYINLLIHGINRLPNCITRLLMAFSDNSLHSLLIDNINRVINCMIRLINCINRLIHPLMALIGWLIVTSKKTANAESLDCLKAVSCGLRRFASLC